MYILIHIQLCGQVSDKQILYKSNKNSQIKKTFSALEKKSLKHLLRHFKNHSIKKIKKHFNSIEIFTFCEFKETEMIRKINELPKNETNTFKDIPVKIVVK